MADKQYEIFISYRRDGGAQYARILQLMLIQRGYRVFLDYDELKDGVFNDRIVKSIKEAPIFIIVLSKGSLLRCLNEGDSVRNEIELAVSENKQIIPVNPDKTFDGIPQGLPPTVAHAVGDFQQSEINFGQALGVLVDYMIANRIADVIGNREKKEKVDEDYDAALETLRKIDRHQKYMRGVAAIGLVVVIAIVLATCFIIKKKHDQRQAFEVTRVELERKYEQFPLRIDANVSQCQLEAIDAIMDQMIEVKEDSLWMSQYEFNCGWWCDIMGTNCLTDERPLPRTDVSYGEVWLFINRLSAMTDVDFALPSEEEWVYSARGGEHYEYSGSGDVDSVAWYEGNSDGKIHPSDGWQNKKANGFDLFDMCGNAGEMCSSPYGERVDGGQWTVCGGNYLSDAKDVRVDSRTGILAEAKAPTVGFRLAIRKHSKNNKRE